MAKTTTTSAEETVTDEPVTLEIAEDSPVLKKLEQTPNVKFIGKNSEPPTSFSSGLHFIEFPAPDEQKAGFYHENAQLICNELPHLYKQIVEKGS